MPPGSGPGAAQIAATGQRVVEAHTALHLPRGPSDGSDCCKDRPVRSNTEAASFSNEAESSASATVASAAAMATRRRRATRAKAAVIVGLLLLLLFASVWLSSCSVDKGPRGLWGRR